MNQYNVATIYPKKLENELVQCCNNLPKMRKQISTMWQQITKNEKTIKYNIAKFTIYLRQEN